MNFSKSYQEESHNSYNKPNGQRKDSDPLQWHKTALFVVPHEDDLEILCFHAVYDLLRSGYKVVEVLMTDGRYGTLNPEFSGKRLKRLRAPEVKCAAAAVAKNTPPENNEIIIEFMGYCDGYVPLNGRSVSKLRAVIEKYNPEIVVGMDPEFAIDWHHDHIATGRNFYLALRSIPRIKRPKKIYVMQSYNNDVYIPLGDYKVAEKALACYRSQLSPLSVKLMIFLQKLIYFLRLPSSGGRMGCGLRKFGGRVNGMDCSIKGFFRIIRNKINYVIFYKLGPRTKESDYTNWYKPLPEFSEPDELAKEDFDFTIAGNLYKFYHGDKI